jgi:hypothetical protein
MFRPSGPLRQILSGLCSHESLFISSTNRFGMGFICFGIYRLPTIWPSGSTTLKR